MGWWKESVVGGRRRRRRRSVGCIFVWNGLAHVVAVVVVVLVHVHEVLVRCWVLPVPALLAAVLLRSFLQQHCVFVF